MIFFSFLGQLNGWLTERMKMQEKKQKEWKRGMQRWWNEKWYLSHLKRCERKSERRRGLGKLRSMYYIRVKVWVRFWSCFFLFVRVTVEVTSKKWTLQMHISCRIYGAIRQHTGQIFECFRHGDHILCHLGFSKYFSFLLSFSPWYLFLSTLGKRNLHHCTLESVNANGGLEFGEREEKELLKIKLNLLS